MSESGRLWEAEQLRSPHAQTDKASRVRGMFDAIAPTYELVNSVFSLGRDRAWRRKAVALSGVSAGESVLDIACGTGDLSRAFAAFGGVGRVVGSDFSAGMLGLAVGRGKRERERGSGRGMGDGEHPGSGQLAGGDQLAAGDHLGIRWVQADALAMPFCGGSFDVTSCAFGVRNFQDLDLGLREMHRLLKAGGRAVILEFTRPRLPLWRQMYEFYSGRLMPWGASLLSRDRTGAYRYLPRSVVSFADAAELRRRLVGAGFDRVDVHPLTLGVVTVFVAYKGRG